MADERRVLLVGASRGLGLGLARVFSAQGWSVTATARGPAAELAAVPGVRVETVDIVEASQVEALRGRLDGARFEVIFIVAGISNGAQALVHTVPAELAAKVFLTNAYAPLVFAERFHDLLAPGGMMAFMTSILGSVGGNTSGGWETYRASKAALNTLGRSYALRHGQDGSTVVLMHPGWVRTDMGGPNATLDVETSTEGMVKVITAQMGRGGCSYLDYKGATVPW